MERKVRRKGLEEVKGGRRVSLIRQMCVKQLSPPCYIWIICSAFHSLRLSLPVCHCSPPPLLPNTHTHTHTPLKQPFSYVTLLEVEPPVLILEFLSCHGTREVQCLPFQLFFFPLHDGCSTLSFFLSRRSQFWLGANNERKQEDRSERGMNWEHPLRCLLLYAHHLLFRVNSGKQEVTWLRMESTGAAMTPSTALRCI